MSNIDYLLYILPKERHNGWVKKIRDFRKGGGGNQSENKRGRGKRGKKRGKVGKKRGKKREKEGKQGKGQKKKEKEGKTREKR